MTTVAATQAGLALDRLPTISDGPDQLKAAAKQFEAIFLRQMLSAARGADFGGKDLFGSQGEETFREMRDARFAEVAAQTGSMGMADMIEAQLKRFLPPAADGSAKD
jgi:flagellar protein FlgJ